MKLHLYWDVQVSISLFWFVANFIGEKKQKHEN